jgi:hypothetical protein
LKKLKTNVRKAEELKGPTKIKKLQSRILKMKHQKRNKYLKMIIIMIIFYHLMKE